MEAAAATQNAEVSAGSQTCSSTLVNGLPQDQCFKSKTWTFPVQGLTKADLTVTKDGRNYTNFNVTLNSNGETILTFADDITYYGWNPCTGSGACNTISTSIGFTINSSSQATGVQNPVEYDYSKLGETWSAPRIFRLPTDGRKDNNIADDRYVACLLYTSDAADE